MNGLKRRLKRPKKNCRQGKSGAASFGNRTFDPGLGIGSDKSLVKELSDSIINEIKRFQ